uniref:Uncharacterized protein n=1 Tax=Tanacetum cinerariifolium TaxID=118510 RepID=A0A6L2ME29_TANCI|nr:hypothetical protein [Tanacetum cinerariifolium]
MESVKNSIDKRAQHKREYDSRVNERHMKTTEEKVDTSKSLDASLVDTKSSVTKSVEQDTSSISGNDAHADDADIRPIYDEEPIDEVHTTAENNIFATGQQYTEQSEFNNEGEVASDDLRDALFVGNKMHKAFPLLVESSHWQYKFPLPVEGVPTARRMEIPLPRVCTAMMKKLPVNSCAKVPSNKTTNKNKPVEQISVAKKLERQISKGHRFSIKKTSVVHEKTMTPRSCLRWKPTGKIFKTIGLRWFPTGKIFNFSTTKVDSEPPNGSNVDITNQYECEQTLDISVELGIHDHSNEPSSSKLVPKVVPPSNKTTTSRQELELLFHQHITMLRLQLGPEQQKRVLIPAESDSLPHAHAHAQTTNTYYKHQDSRIKKAQVLKTKTFANSDIKDPSLETKLQGRFLASFQDDAKYEHVGTKTQDRKVEKMIKTEG